MSAFAKRVGKLVPQQTSFMLCDIQERFRDLIWHYPAVINTATFMVDVGREMRIPIVATEQYPKAFGTTVPEISLQHENPDLNIALFEKKQKPYMFLFSNWSIYVLILNVS